MGIRLCVRRWLQLDRHSCGPCSCASILEYFGARITAHELAEELDDPTEGTSIGDIRKWVSAYGLALTYVRSLAAIRRSLQQKRPVLVSVDGDHWSVVTGYDEDGMYVMDPSLIRSLGTYHTMRRFTQRWDKQGWAVSPQTSKHLLPAQRQLPQPLARAYRQLAVLLGPAGLKGLY